MKIFLIPCIVLFISLNALAQPKREKIKALKVAFITERVDLSAKEAEQFWPIYNTYNNTYRTIKRDKINSTRREIKKNIDTLTDEQALVYINIIEEAEKKLLKERIELIKKLKNVISPKKIILLKIAEEDFNKKLFDQFKNRHKFAHK
ncbi:sensor of ECF-type sigma factor [uncultured Algibacter sp.]|uniref:sensor of ECF-type sigma factor n=1 Tax=uncultured Algibacter sp. TaxID=298659 RepID=UPI003217DD01